ncbi:hypothetical protein ACFL0M_04745 [Thermodesulfobacteriota bacterium]
MAENNKDSFADKVNKSLGEFFGDEAEPEDPLAHPESNAPQESPFTDLKAIVLSIEWEITDQIMGRLIAETDSLMKIWQDNKIILSLLKLLNSVGKYINSKKANAHPDSIKLLHSIHANIQKVVASATITEAAVNKILSGEISKFKKLKQKLLTKTVAPRVMGKKVAVKAGPAADEKAATPMETETKGAITPEAAAHEDSPPSEVGTLPFQDALLVAIEETKNLIKLEFKKLHEELKLLRP